MPTATRSIVVNAPIDYVITLTNRLELWPQIMKEYREVEILRREGWKIWFRLLHENGTTWESWRVVCPQGRFALAERHSPRAPFKFMQHVWRYHPVGAEQTEMTWEMTFGLPDDKQADEEPCSRYLLSHSAENQLAMKNFVEARYREAPDV